MSAWVSQIISDGARHVMSPEAQKLTYGTAGYRTKGSVLPTVAYRIGALAALRSLHLGGKALGIMVTASHNPPQDNGLKVIDPSGGMLDTSLEETFSKAVQAVDFASHLDKLAQEWHVKPGESFGSVLLGGDTRDSTPSLVACANEGVAAVLGAKGCGMDYGVVTTPQLHILVALWNSQPPGNSSFVPPAASAYYERLCTAFQRLTQFWPSASLAKPLVCVDCAHGVGAIALQEVAQRLANHITIRLFNAAETEQERAQLNSNCGADYVKIQCQVPQLNPLEAAVDASSTNGAHWCSLDGDADRIIYWVGYPHNQSAGDSTNTQQQPITLLDGDRIACLMTRYLQQCLSQIPAASPPLRLGMVYTAYTNAAATQFMRDKLGVQVACVKTGVKHLHHRAAEFDIGVYFEANGHGTVLFSPHARQFIATLSPESCPLPHVVNMINECTGDALSDLLLTEHILWSWQWSVGAAAESVALGPWLEMYQDWPSRQLKVLVPDRYAIRTNDDETRVVHPTELQDGVDALVEQHAKITGKHARAFLRPSGTEDIVRVYAEGATQQVADQLAQEVVLLVRRTLCSGDGSSSH